LNIFRHCFHIIHQNLHCSWLVIEWWEQSYDVSSSFSSVFCLKLWFSTTDKKNETTILTEEKSYLNWQVNWTYNAITSLLLNTFIVRTTDLEKTVNMNWLLTWLSVTTITDAFLRKSNVWAHDQLSGLCRNTRQKQTSQVSNPCIRPKFRKSPSLYGIYSHYASLCMDLEIGMQTVFSWITNVMYKDFPTTTSQL